MPPKPKPVKQNAPRRPRKPAVRGVVLSPAPVPISGAVVVNRRRPARVSSLPNGVVRVANQAIIPLERSKTDETLGLQFDLTVANAKLPFLSNISKVFDKFAFDKLVIKFIPTLPTTAGGTVAISFDMNLSDPTETSISSFMATGGAMSGPLWQVLTMRVPKLKLRSREWFTCYQGSTTTENSFRAIGTFRAISTPIVGVTITTKFTVGYLELDYVVRLSTPSVAHTTVPTQFAEQLDLVSYNTATVDLYKQAIAEFGPLPFPLFYKAFTATTWVCPWGKDLTKDEVLDLQIERVAAGMSSLLL